MFSNLKTNHIKKLLHTITPLFLVATSAQSSLAPGLVSVASHTLFCLNFISLFHVATFAQSPLVCFFIANHTKFHIIFGIEAIMA
jgi:hypothetical protein